MVRERKAGRGVNARWPPCTLEIDVSEVRASRGMSGGVAFTSGRVLVTREAKRHMGSSLGGATPHLYCS